MAAVASGITPPAPTRPRVPALQEAIAADPLLSLVHTALDASPYLESTHLRIEAEQGAVKIHGKVATFFEKQMAQETVRRLDGVERVENLLEVNWR
ncbi:MAG: BON domain-containing protein [Planctomycetota bacterium]